MYMMESLLSTEEHFSVQQKFSETQPDQFVLQICDDSNYKKGAAKITVNGRQLCRI